MKKKILSLCDMTFVMVFLTTLFLLACGTGGRDKRTEAVHEDRHGDETAGIILHLTPQMKQEWEIAVGSPESRDYVEKIELTGTLQVNRNTTCLVHSLAPGAVAAVKTDIGETVKAGGLLCILKSAELLTLKTNYIKAHQELLFSRQNYDSAKNLFAAKALEKKELISRETTYITNLANYLSLQAELHSLDFNRETLEALTASLAKGETGALQEFLSPFYYISSPIAGKVVSRDITVGEILERSKTIFEISDTKKLWAILDARESDLRFLEKDKKVDILCDLYPGQIFPARISAVPEQLDSETRTLKIRAEVSNDKYLLKPEMYVTGALQKNIKKNYLAVPAGAVVRISGVDGIFRAEKDGFIFTPVLVAARDAAGFVFIEGLKPQETIVTRGTYYLKAQYELSRGAVDAEAGHQH